jgi:hypothetical protein
MGGSESSDKGKDMTIGEHMPQMFRSSPYLDNAYPLTKYDDQRYGEHERLEVSYDRQIIKKRIKVKDDRQFQTYLKNKQQRMNFDQNLFVKLLDYDAGPMHESEQEDGTYKYYIDCYFEHHQNDLRQEIDARISNSQPFSPQEMKEIIDFFTRTGSSLEAVGSRHGDLRPEFVAFNDERKPLLMDNMRNKPGTGGRLAFISNIDMYISPALYQHYCHNVVKFKHDKSKDDIFSAGLIILEAGIIESIQPIYDSEQGKVRMTILSEYIERFEQNYSSNPEFSQTLRSMLVADEVDRLSFKEIGSRSGTATNQVPRQQLQSTVQPQNYYAQPQPQVYAQPQYVQQHYQPQQTYVPAQQSYYNPQYAAIPQQSYIVAQPQVPTKSYW